MPWQEVRWQCSAFVTNVQSLHNDILHKARRTLEKLLQVKHYDNYKLCESIAYLVSRYLIALKT